QRRRQLQLQPRHLLLAQQLQQRRQHPQLLLLAQQLRQQLRLLRQLQLKLRLPRLAQAPRQQLPLQLKLRLRQQLRRQLRQQRLRQPPLQQPQVTSAPCPTGYVRTPSGACVNLRIDFNNCGSIGYVCSSTYTSCSNGACSGAPAVQLIGGVTITGWGGTVNVDDAYVTISLPFSITLYGYTTSSASVQSNGCVCLSGCSSDYTNGPLPSGSFSGPTAFGYWDDLFIFAGTSQSVYYGTTGTYPNRNLVFEFYMAHFGASTLYYHFQIVFFEATPNVVRYLYYQVSDSGASCTIGVQGSGSGPSMTYSVDTAGSVPTGSPTTSSATLTLTFNTASGTYSSSG
ncbi:unnamed protein product, partial [Rotaria socialis]